MFASVHSTFIITIYCNNSNRAPVLRELSVDQKKLMLLLNHRARLLNPSEIVTKENPRKSPRQPPNSANKEVNG